MSTARALDTLRALHAQGALLRADGRRLAVDAVAPLPDELAAQVRATAKSLWWVVSGRWRAEAESWTGWRLAAWHRRAESRRDDGQDPETAARWAYLEVAELPDELPPLPPVEPAPVRPPAGPAPLLDLPPDVDPDDPAALALDLAVEPPAAAAPAANDAPVETAADRAARHGYRIDRWGSYVDLDAPDGRAPFAPRFAVGVEPALDPSEADRQALRARVAADCRARLGPGRGEATDGAA